MSVPRSASLIHTFTVGRFQKFIISLVNKGFYNDRHSLRLIFLDGNFAPSPGRERIVIGSKARKYNYDLQAGR
jgi:hypothetical protein